MTCNTLPVLTVNGLVDCRVQLIFLCRVELMQMTIAADVGWHVSPSELFTNSLTVPERNTSS